MWYSHVLEVFVCLVCTKGIKKEQGLAKSKPTGRQFGINYSVRRRSIRLTFRLPVVLHSY